MHSMLLFVISFYQGIWRFSHTFVGTVALGSWFAAPFVGGLMAYCQNEDREHRSLRGLVRYCFPHEILSQPSCRLDLLHQVTKLLLRPLLQWIPLLGIFAVAITLYTGFSSVWGIQIPIELGIPARLGTTLIFVLIVDASYFHVHYLQHKVKVLWELHKVHHSSEWLLLMLSNRRAHPLEELLGGLMNGVAVGIAAATLCYEFDLDVHKTLDDGGRAYLLLNALSFYHLRHSHLKLGYGWLERYVVSPSQHHIHHAYETYLWDKNFGWLLSVWDRMYGTLVYSRDVKAFPVGLPLAQRESYNTAWKLMVVPIGNIARLMGHASASHAANTANFLRSMRVRQLSDGPDLSSNKMPAVPIAAAAEDLGLGAELNPAFAEA